MHILKTIIATATGLSLVACGGGGSDAPSNNADLQGIWFGQCEADEDGDSTRDEWNISGNSATQSAVTYISATDCSGPLTVSVNVPATFTVDGMVTDVTGGPAKHVDVVYSPGNITASSATISNLESQGTTLSAIYAAEGIPDINNVSLADLGLTQANLYSIYRVSGNQLQVGDTNDSLDGSSPALRPTSLDASFSLTRQ